VLKNSVREKKTSWRWLILFIVGMVMFGAYYAYDTLSPINDYIQKDMGINNARFGLLFSLYALPNILFLLVVAGFLLDRLGIRKAGIFYTFIILLGSVITSLGAGNSFIIMLIGRMIFGIGTEATLLVTYKVIARWFKGKEFGFAYGLKVSIIRLGSILALNSSAQVANLTGSWRWSIWIGTIVMFISCILFLLYLTIDKDVDKSIEAGKEEKIVFQEVWKLKPAFWFICLLCMTSYGAILPFGNHSPRFLQKKFGFSMALGGQYTSYITVAAMIFTPLFGFIVDKLGYRGKLLFIGALFLVPAHLILGLTHINPGLSFIILGVSYSMVPPALWSTIPFIIKERFLGTAVSIISWTQMIGLFIFPWLAGEVVDLSGDDYTNMELMFAFIGFIGLLLSILLIMSNKKHDFGLELPAYEAQSKADASA
jgi:MFS family permease